jgi:preprotein translocase subunit YajC
MNSWIQVAMASAPGGSAGGSAGAPDSTSMIVNLLPLVLIFVLFYLLFILPQRKQQKQHQEILKNLKKGEEVVTSGGIYGTIVGFNERDNSVYLKLGENVKIEIQRASVSGLRKASNPSETAKLN